MNHEFSTDMRALNHLPLTIIGDILSGGRLIYTRDEIKRIQFETQARGAYFDFLPVIQQYRAAYRQKLAGSLNGIH